MTLRLAEVDLTGSSLDVTDCGDVDGATGRLMSVAQLQHVMRLARQQTADGTRTQRSTGRLARSSTPIAYRCESADSEPVVRFVASSTDQLCVVVRAAHAGSGASTVALAVADAAAVGGRSTHLIEFVTPNRSGLLGVATAELGLDATQRWRYGTRGKVTVSRRADSNDLGGAAWPSPIREGAEAGEVTILDVGATGGDDPGAAGDDPSAGAPNRGDESVGPITVVAFRVTVPGVRHAEHVLRRLTGTVVLAAVGPASWPGEVKTTSGPLLARQRVAGHLITVPLDRRLEVTGLHAGPLPKSVAAAGRDLLAVLDAARRSGVPPTLGATAALIQGDR
jgi:hypothetical protein